MARTIKVDYLARVEGEGAMFVQIEGDEVVEVRLKIFEPPRFFEALLRGRDHKEAPDITARICGICPVAYQMSAVHAMERALGVQPGPQIRALRRLLYCGEWIESHGLHIFMLHAPDFMGYAGAVEMAGDHPELVKLGLRLKKSGNDIVNLLGGREIHPINVRVGGFYRLPTKAELRPLRKTMVEARDAALEAVRWTSTLSFPDFERDYTFVALRHPSEYPFNEGRLVSNKGLDIEASEFEAHFEELHVAHSNALHCVMKGDPGTPYFVGPMARYSLNFDRLSPSVQQAALDAGLGEVCRNPFKSIIVRAVEVLFACDEALRVIDNYEEPEDSAAAIPAQLSACQGWSITEAPRGILYHRYALDETGTILDAKIVPPTSQNQKIIEDDLKEVVLEHLSLDDEAMTHRCEQAIRNYDPCISCATHFLKLTVEREGSR